MRSIFLNDEPAAPVELDTRESAASVNAMHGLLLVVTLIVVFGLTMLYSASYNTDGLKYFRNQIIWAAMGGLGGAGGFRHRLPQARVVESLPDGRRLPAAPHRRLLLS